MQKVQYKFGSLCFHNSNLNFDLWPLIKMEVKLGVWEFTKVQYIWVCGHPQQSINFRSGTRRMSREVCTMGFPKYSAYLVCCFHDFFLFRICRYSQSVPWSWIRQHSKSLL